MALRPFSKQPKPERKEEPVPEEVVGVTQFFSSDRRPQVDSSGAGAQKAGHP